MTIQDHLSENKLYIIEQYKSGVSMNKLAELFDCNSGSIYYFLNNNNVRTRKRQKLFDGDIGKFDVQIINMYNSGSSCSEISRTLGPCLPAIIERLVKLGLDPSRYSDVKKGNLLKDKWLIVEKMFKDGISCRQIGKELGHSGPEVGKLLKRYGYMPSQTKYNVDESFFEKIDTPEKAYIFGFLLADGNVMHNCFRWQIQEGDKDTLEKIAKELQYDGPIATRLSNNESHQNMVELYIGRKKMSRDLIILGCPPAKSLGLKFPSNVVPLELMSHMMRGYNDGDGSISSTIGYTGSYDFIYGSIKVLPVDHYAIYQRYKEKDIRDTAHSLVFNRKSDQKLYLDWIYQDSSIHMNRKYDKYLEFCKENNFTPVKTAKTK